MGFLDEVRRRAEAIQGQQEAEAERRARNVANVDAALRRAFQYFHELSRCLAVIRPTDARRFAIPGLGEIEGLVKSQFFCDFRTVDVLQASTIEHFYLRYSASSGGELRRELDVVAAEQVARFLGESAIRHVIEDIRNASHKLVGKRFVVPCAISSEIVFRAEPETGLVRVRARNVDWLGADEFVYEPDELETSLLDEYGRFIAGEPHGVRGRGRYQSGAAAVPQQR